MVDREKRRDDVRDIHSRECRGIAGVVLLVGCVLAAASVSLAAVQAGQVAPDFRLPLLNGSEISLEQFKGKPIVLDFWDSS